MQIDEIGPNPINFIGSFDRVTQSPSGKTLCAALSPDGSRAYVGGHSGVWRSDDGGLNWWHPEWLPSQLGGATAAGALLPPNVYDVVVSAADPDIVFAAASDDVRRPPLDGLYRSTDGAQHWSLAHRFLAAGGAVGFVGCIAAATDDPTLLLAAGTFAIGRSTDGGNSWTEVKPDPNAAVNHVVCGPANLAGRRVYASGTWFWYSSDAGATWTRDPMGPGIGAQGAAGSAGARSLAVHPFNDLIVYAAVGDTVWRGEFADRSGPAVWTQVPSPPIAGISASGANFILAHPLPSGHVVLYVSDRRSVHATTADPRSSADYTRVDVGVHVDPHGLAVTPDFCPWSPDIRPASWGRALLVNDGGAEASSDGAQTWEPGRGLTTLNAANVGINTLPDGPTSITAITFGGGDNGGFSSGDGGLSWRTQDYLGGDNDCAFSDPRQPTRMLLFAPRSGPPGQKGEVYLFASGSPNPPDTVYGSTVRQRIPGPRTVNADGAPTAAWNAVSSYFNYGYRPLVFTLAGLPPRPDGDFITIRWLGVPRKSTARLLRTTAISQIAAPTDWDTDATSEAQGSLVFRVGPDLPKQGIGVVQGSGGHERPTFYVSDVDSGGTSVWKLSPGSTEWETVVPAAGTVGPARARRFFVDPYRPQRVYVLADDSVYRSDDGAQTWTKDAALDRAVTESGAFPRMDSRSSNAADLKSPNPAETVLRDMQFDPTDPNYRLAIGIAGVFLTRDGNGWAPLLRSSALALQPTSMLYDPMACERTLYVGTMGRGLLRLRPLPPDWTMPIGSLGSAQGRVTLLRVHDVGTAYGPPYDRLDAEVIVTLDSEPGHAFGLQLRRDANEGAATGMLDLLRGAFNNDGVVALDFIRNGCQTGRIVRVMDLS